MKLIVVLVLALAAGPAVADPPKTAQIGPATVPVDEQGRYLLEGIPVAPDHVRPWQRGPGEPICVMVCSSYGLGVPMKTTPAWARYCLET